MSEEPIDLEVTIVPSSGQAAISATTESIPIPSESIKSTVTPISTPEPTAKTLSFTATSTSTSTPKVTSTPSTTEVTEVVVESTTIPLEDMILTATPDLSAGVTETLDYSSPTGVWNASLIQTYAPGRTVYQRIVVTGEQSEVTAAERWAYSGLGSDAPQLLQWSADESVLWYGFFGVPDGCSIGGFWSGVSRLDLLTGEETLIGDDIFAIPAPDEQTFVELDGRNLIIRNQAERDEKQIQLPILETQVVGRPIWNPTSERVAFLVTESSGECQFSNSVLYIILPNVKIHQTQFTSEPLLFIDQWVSNDVLSLVDVEGGKWFLNTNDGGLTEQE